jgi:predicted phosphate transport protein (TIGR00153 family)
VPFQVIPREQVFFDLLNESAANLVGATAELAVLAEDFTDAEDRSQRIRDMEHRGDDLTRAIVQRLDVTFVTPFDRDDLYSLASGLDEILDAVWAAADLVVLHQIAEPLPEMRQLAGVLRKAGAATLIAVRGLRDNHDVMPYVMEVNRLENEGDRIYRRAVARMYSGEFKAMDVLKWRDVLGQMEAALDSCEDIANVIESIVVKYD